MLFFIKDLTYEMLVHVNKIISLDSYLNITFNDIIFYDMHEYFVS